MEDYIQGQLDLIDHIKNDLQKIVDNEVKGDDIMLDVVSILQNLKPINKPNNS